MLSNSEVAVFCEQSGMILESGLSMLEGISIMEEDVEPHNTEYKKMYEDMRMCLEETGIFHEALTKTGLFPSYVIQMTKIGEETGNLDVVMKGLAAYYEREENTMQDIKSAISYPLMILCMLLAIMLVMVVKVVPVFNQVYEQLGTQITGPGAVLLKAGEALKQDYSDSTSLRICSRGMVALKNNKRKCGITQTDRKGFFYKVYCKKTEQCQSIVCFFYGITERYGLWTFL